MENERQQKRIDLVAYKQQMDVLRDQGEYVEPYPIEYRREFWKYDLNPITGMPAVIDKTYVTDFAYLNKKLTVSERKALKYMT